MRLSCNRALPSCVSVRWEASLHQTGWNGYADHTSHSTFHLEFLRDFLYERLLTLLPHDNNTTFTPNPVCGMMVVLDPERDTDALECAFKIVDYRGFYPAAQ